MMGLKNRSIRVKDLYVTALYNYGCVFESSVLRLSTESKNDFGRSMLWRMAGKKLNYL